MSNSQVKSACAAKPIMTKQQLPWRQSNGARSAATLEYLGHLYNLVPAVTLHDVAASRDTGMDMRHATASSKAVLLAVQR